ncbi:MAG: hypothetical protein CM1200mP28_01510 [Deltaproteobacteria bacterium]|nr:MAG: hypothetical protein CM1200mP28_01510 [Deltaproteobacteria bacterium]
MSNQLSAQFRLKLLRVARQSLENFLENGNLIQFPTEIPELLEKRAVFVTLRNRKPRRSSWMPRSVQTALPFD